jgi:hypothetical protein
MKNFIQLVRLFFITFIDDLSDIFSQTSNEDVVSKKEGDGMPDKKSLVVIDIPTTPRSAPPVEQLFSPGQFFSQKSGKLGYLGDAKAGTERPLWYTPKMDAAGCMLDPIEATPTESNKLVFFLKRNLKASNTQRIEIGSSAVIFFTFLTYVSGIGGKDRKKRY